MDKYLIKYLRDNSEDELSSKYIDFFKIELDWHIYNNERHIAERYHREKKSSFKEEVIKTLQYCYAIAGFSDKIKSDKSNVLSTLPFLDQLTLQDLNLISYSPVWHPIGKKNIFGDLQSIKWHKKIQKIIQKEDFYSFLNKNLHFELEEFQNHFFKQYKEKDFRALLLHTDQNFYSKYFIDIFKKLEKPSIVFSHGLPAIYSKDIDNRSDFLMVWSDKIKENYLKAGFDSEKIKVVGNPHYKKNQKNKELRSDLSDILVVPVSSILWHQHEYDSTVLVDKSMVVLYLYKVQKVLEKLGVKQARYRTHPSINKDWVHAFLDQNFYIMDNQELAKSINRSSLVIGATSTVLLESLIYGVNYIVFEPKDSENVNMAGFKLVPPFDGSDEKVITAKDENELENMLRNNNKTDYSLLKDYIQDFDISVMKELIK
ncbi:hypothetical protein [Flavobacterium sp.]|uniref:hypothetical protein n=1 Tax=Flavobacterium sp. TaxID=239 RepID=UPI0031D0AB71